MSKIVIAEDDDAMREFLAQALSRRGHSVSTASNGAEALRAIEGCDLLLTDVRMPGVDGVSLARCVASEYPETAVIFVTGFAHEVRHEPSLDNLKLDVLSKPFQLNDLVQAVDRMLAA